MDSRAGLDGCEKSRTYRHFFLSPPVLSLYLFALVPFSLTVLADSCVFTVQHIHATGWIFFFCSLYFICSLLLCPDCPGFDFCPLLYNTHNTNIHAPGGVRTRNPSMRAATYPRLRPLNQRGWFRSPHGPARSKSLYRLSYSGPKVESRRSETAVE